MAKKLTLTQIKQNLQQKNKSELITEIAHLYKKFPQVKEYFQVSLGQDDSELLEEYKQIVRHEFVQSARNYLPKMRLSVARKAISDFKKVAISNRSIADIMLTYVESGVIFTNDFGDISEPFYISMESMYDKTCKFIAQEELFYEFDTRLIKVLKDTREMGWGFHDQLTDIYDKYFKDMIV